MKYWILSSVLCSLVFACHGETTPNTTQNIQKNVKGELLKDIIQKICHIALGPLRNATAVQKQKLFRKLEKRVRSASKVLKYDNENYINIIMEGIKLISGKEDYSLCAQVVPNMRENIRKSHHKDKVFRAHNDDDTNSIKVDIIRTMLSKLQGLADKYLKNANTTEQKNVILEKIKTRVSDALRRRHIINGKNDTYSDIIMQGLKVMMMQKKDNDSRRMTLELLANPKGLLRPIEGDPLSTTTTAPLGITTPIICELEFKKICSALEGVSTVVCKYDDTKMSLERVCDGHIDCPDGSDEKNCANQAVVKVHAATEISTLIDRARPCFTSVTEDNLFAQQSKMLQDLLETQINFIKKYRDENIKGEESTKLVQLDDQSVAELSNEVFGVIRTFEITLNAAFCKTPDVIDMDNMLDERFGKIGSENIHADILETPKMDHKICTCSGKLCTDSKCPMFCKRICYQRFSLKRLFCRSINNENSIPLNEICDGKFDCYDEADEHGCTLGQTGSKFEAQYIFHDIQKMIKSKISSSEFKSSNNRLISLYEAFKLVSKRSVENRVNTDSFRTLRDKCFDLLLSVYDDALDVVTTMPTAETIFNFLESIKDKFIVALKKSRTGNLKVLAADGCYCREAYCATPQCSKKCARTCAAKPLFTKFTCKNSVGNNTSSIPIEAVCNGKPNCPNGEDELGCKTDICRPHHLVLLRHHLKSVGEKHKGTVIGEILDTWKTKVLSNIMIVEKRERPTPRTIKELILEICSDLVTSYASLEEFRRTNNEGVLRKFEKLAQRIIETSKSCGQ